MTERAAPTDSLVERLHEIASWVSSSQDLEKLLELVLETAAGILNAKAGSILLLNRRTKKLVFKAATGEKKQEVKSFTINLGQGIAGHVAETGKPLLISNVTNDPLWDSSISHSLRLDTQSIACVPMQIDGRIIGVLEVIDKTDGRPLTENDLRDLSVFSDVAARAIQNAKRFEKVSQEYRDLREELAAKHQIVGKSQTLKRITTEALKVANSSASTLILGESGTGKELLAHLIHRSSPRKDGPLVVLNCAALQETLLEAELFGYEKGAFTGAVGRRIGKVEQAQGGTLFLDEIGELPTAAQARLLRVLQGGEHAPGEAGDATPDVRILAATHRDLRKLVQDNAFRSDLYFRLRVVELSLPPLRERRDDIVPLADHFRKQFAAAMIPELAEALSADLIVLGTVGRTGVPGFFIGNTAEKTLAAVDCSVLAVKPGSFRTPVRV